MTGSFRRRLTLTFVLVAAISAGSLAVISFLLVKQHRSTSFVERSLDKAQLASTIAEGRLSPQPSSDEITSLIETLERRAAMKVVLRSGDRTFSSIPGLDIDSIDAALRDGEAAEGLRSTDVELEGHHYRIVTSARPADPEFFFFFSRENLIDQMDRLSTLLWRLWLGLALISALVGYVVARRTLRPIAKAGEAAIALAEGILDTRLPIDRSDEFGVWAASFNRMASALEEKINELEDAAERERRFTSDVAHELRTPLSALVTSTEMLTSQEAEMGPQAAWAAERLSTQVKRLRRLVEELLEISRLDAGRESLNLSRVDLRDLISRLLQHHGWTDRVRALVDDGDIATDTRRMDRIVGNLISNSIEHGKGIITVRATIQGSDLVVDVEDEGASISATDAGRVFDRFYKADPARPGGSGLGLSIARENARLLGGDITLSSSPAGTRFTARLPATSDGNESGFQEQPSKWANR
ncbi:MAG: ATP-binding protein [Actinomycetota bacterium]